MMRLLALCVVLLASGCSSDDRETSGNGGSGNTGGVSGTGGAGGTDGGGQAGTGGTSPNEAGSDVSPDSDAAADAPSDSPLPDSSPDVTSDVMLEAMPDVGPDVVADVGPVSSCSELATNDCFANNECAPDRRCENAGTDSVPVPCCVPGPRGSGQAGDPCTNENDCESGVCIAGSGAPMCSQTCTTINDCPDGMKNCTLIAFSGSNDKWCLPTD